MKRALLPLALMLWVACEPAPMQIELHDQPITVHSMLRAGEDSVRVFVARVDTRDTNQTESLLVPVANAHVRIAHGADTAVLSTRSHCVNGLNGFPPNSSDLTTGCYAGVIKGGVRSGERYQLFVDAVGERVRGQAVVPALPVLQSPSSGITLHYSSTRQLEFATSVLVRWSGTEPDQRIDLSLRALRQDCAALIATPPVRFGSERIALMGIDTATIATFDVSCPDNTQSIFPAELLLTTYDAAYTRMRPPGPTVRPEAAAVGLTEGLGVFAAAASVAMPVTLVRR